jgi:hypothetical protein
MSQSKQDADEAAKPHRVGKFKWLAIAFFVVLAAVAVKNLPRGFSDDLSLVGKGKPSIVFIRDKNAVQTFGMLEVMNGIRDKYAGRVEFLLTDFNTPQGRAFMAASKAPSVTFVLLDVDGKMVKIIYPPQTVESLQQEIDGALKAASQSTSDGTISQSTRLSKDNSQVAGYGRAPG